MIEISHCGRHISYCPLDCTYHTHSVRSLNYTVYISKEIFYIIFGNLYCNQKSGGSAEFAELLGALVSE